MNWKRMLTYVTGSVDEELLARNEYLVTENQILRGQIQGRIRLTDPERIRLAFGRQTTGPESTGRGGADRPTGNDSGVVPPVDRQEVRRFKESATR